MTMPHLMNCPHRDDAWCLDCVKAEWERNQAKVEQLQAISKELCESIDELGDTLFGTEEVKLTWRQAKAHWWQRCIRAVNTAEKEGIG